MHSSGRDLLNLMFRPGENVCVSDSKYAFHSVPLEQVFSDIVTLVSPSPDIPIRKVTTDKLLLCALNPIKGFRCDQNVTAYRNFLLEIDTGSIAEQYAYIKKLQIPYSAIVFSGNKSLHILVSLKEDLPDEASYRKVSQWMLNVATICDQQTKNPSRSIRIAGAEREPGKLQKLAVLKGVVSLKELNNWLNKYPDSKPKPYKKQEVSTDGADFNSLKRWTKNRLKYGLQTNKGRNAQWFSISLDFCLNGFNEDATVGFLSKYFTPEVDFSEKEWLTTIRSAFKHVYRTK